MRFTTLAWFYNAEDTLLHIRYLESVLNTPNRSNNDLFGGLPIQSFCQQLRRETQLKTRIYEYTDLYRQKIKKEIPYYHEEILGTAQIQMDINYPLTELFAHLTRGEPLSKIVIRQYEIESDGRMIPFIQYTFKDCWLIEHKTDAPVEDLESYLIKFTYCCLDLHYFDGNRFGKHERCKANEPDEKTVYYARYREGMAHKRAIQDQQTQEASRLAPLYREYPQGPPVIHHFDVTATSEFNGKQISPGGLDGIAFHLVEKVQTVDALIDYLYDNPSAVTRTHFKQVNHHLKDGIVLPAQVVLITPEDTMRKSEQEFLAMARLDEIEMHRQNLKIDPLVFSENFINYANMAGHGAKGLTVVTTYFQAYMQQVKKVLNELQKAYAKDFRMPGGAVRMKELTAYRQQKYKELDSLLTKAMQSKFYGGMGIRKMRNRVKLNADTIAHHWRFRNTHIIPELAKFYGNAVNFANALKVFGNIAIALDIGAGAYQTNETIVKACTVGEEACKKAKYVEWSGFVGNVGLGLAGGSLASQGVLLLLTFTTVGGLTAVAIVAGVGIGAGVLGGIVGTYAFKELGLLLYEYNQEANRDILVETIGN